MKQVIEDYKYPCYDFRWFIGCCIYYPVEDTVILGDMELVITTVKRMKRKYPDEWMKRINVRHDKYGGHTVTSLAILEKRNDIAEWLIENGLDIDQRDAKTGLAPLHHAVRQQCLTDKFKSTIDALIEYGCEIDIRDKVSFTLGNGVTMLYALRSLAFRVAVLPLALFCYLFLLYRSPLIWN